MLMDKVDLSMVAGAGSTVAGGGSGGVGSSDSAGGSVGGTGGTVAQADINAIASSAGSRLFAKLDT